MCQMFWEKAEFIVDRHEHTLKLCRTLSSPLVLFHAEVHGHAGCIFKSCIGIIDEQKYELQGLESQI